MQLIKRCEPKFGDILLTRIGTLAKSKIIDWNGEFSIYVSLALLSSIKINNNFLNQYIKTEIYQKDFFKRSLLLAVPQKINLKDLNETIIKYPSNKEEDKIASYLNLIDKKIELLEKKLQLYVVFKKYLMQQIFTQKLRFKKEEYEKWENLQLKDIISLNGGYAFKSDLFKDEGMPIIRISNISSNNSVIFKDLVYYDKIKNDSDFIIKKGDLIIAMSGATTGKVAVYDFDYNSYINQRVGVFKSISKKLYYPFLVQYTLSESFKIELQKTLVAGAQPNISKKEIESFRIKLPNFKEQKKIANLLSLLDIKINTIQNEHFQISKFKKSLLQQMFV